MKKIIIAVVVIAIVFAGGYLVYQQMGKPEVAQNNQVTPPPANNQINNPPITPPITIEPPAATAREVIYTDSGFSPATLTIKAGETVVFRNQSSSLMWVGSSLHPSHTVYSGTALGEHCPDTTNTSFDQCKSDGPGTSWSFTFTKVGTWGYHNHAKANAFGKVVVE